MAVYTEVAFEEAEELIGHLKLGRLVALAGCAGGIENTNYFLTVEQQDGPHELVLTLFERLSAAQLPFYLRLMQHLAARGLPVPDPASDSQGRILHCLKGKPSAVVNRLAGQSALAPTTEHCAMMGGMVARMHLAATDFDLAQPNLRALPWWNQTVTVIMPFLDPAQSRLIQSELAYQNHLAAQSLVQALPRGPVHADLFRDNVLFQGSGSDARVTGVFDFYFAGVDSWLFDLAVCLNDWCVDLDSGAPNPLRTHGLLAAYSAVRPLLRQERELLNGMLRAAALRFWVSRLWDLHLPRHAAVLKPHDPDHFERVLRQRIEYPLTFDSSNA